MLRRASFSIALTGLLSVTLLGAAGAAAQAVDRAPTRVGLALSGGGAKGLAHVGVLRALEEAGVRVDVVAGTSMGSLVGALYAVGYGPDEIEERLGSVDWQAVLTDRPDRTHLTVERRLAGERAVVSFPIRGGRVGLPTGVVRGVRGTRVLHRLLWPALAVDDFDALPRPFAAVATDIETGEAVTLRTGSLVRAIRASLAIPGVLEPVRMNGRLLVDGGVARNLPARDARALGADLLICSDVSEPLNEADELSSLFDILMQTVSFQMQASTVEERERCDVLLEPDTEDLASFDFGPTVEWVRRGEDAVREASAALAALQRRVGPAPLRSTPASPPLPSRVGVSRVEVTGSEGRTAELARSTVSDLAGATVDAEVLDRAVARLHAEDLFDLVIYRLDPSAGDTTVVFELVEEPGDRLDLGIRYDDHRQASLLFGTSLHDLVGLGSWTRLDLRLGEELQAAARVLYGLVGRSRFTVAADARYTRAILDRWEGGRQVAEVRSGIGAASLFAGTALGRTTLAGVEVGVERSRTEASIAPEDSSEVVGHWTVGARVIRDTFDRAAFPTRGISVLGVSEWTRRFSGQPGFRQFLGRVAQLVPLGASTTLRLEVAAGITEGAGVPAHRRFFLGGAYPSAVLPETQIRLVGVEPQSLEGLAFQRVALAVQRRLASQLFLTVAVEAGGAAERWRLEAGDWTRGYGVALGALTPLGPLEVTLAGHDGGGWPGLSVVLGPRF